MSVPGISRRLARARMVDRIRIDAVTRQLRKEVEAGIVCPLTAKPSEQVVL